MALARRYARSARAWTVVGWAPPQRASGEGNRSCRRTEGCNGGHTPRLSQSAITAHVIFPLDDSDGVSEAAPLCYWYRTLQQTNLVWDRAGTRQLISQQRLRQSMSLPRHIWTDARPQSGGIRRNRICRFTGICLPRRRAATVTLTWKNARLTLICTVPHCIAASLPHDDQGNPGVVP